jgi:hypothetical protein
VSTVIACSGSLLLGLTASCSSDPLPAAADSDADGGSVCQGFCNLDATFDGPLLLQVKDRIDRICANADGCHGGGTAGMMVLVPGHEFETMIDVVSFEMPPMLRVAPGDPENSYVYKKLACEGGIVLSCMPLGFGLDPNTVRIFHDWIEAGAPTE